jgi:hypothetical protein
MESYIKIRSKFMQGFWEVCNFYFSFKSNQSPYSYQRQLYGDWDWPAAGLINAN